MPKERKLQATGRFGLAIVDGSATGGSMVYCMIGGYTVTGAGKLDVNYYTWLGLLTIGA